MAGKGSTISTEEPRLGNLRVQTSMYGLAQPMVWGQTRVTGNLLWFGSFQAIATTTTTSQGGGKGGGGVTQVDTKYSYKAAAIMSIARGPILGIASGWKGKRRYMGVTVPGSSVLRTEVHDVSGASTVVNVSLGGVAGGVFGGTVSVAPLLPTTGYGGEGL